ncbi:MurR/RpiR family transcriptional regulator [Salinarimonas sp.]|uniref:MurR/RpiR family transcriptional regulator n=1 Tax=Salinarimonas sp. TaxID=2766526 RepID=UPI0032D909FB
MQPSPPADFEDLRQRLSAMHDGLPKRLRQCAAYVLREPDRIAFDTVAEAAAAAEVPPSAMIRFSKLVGYSGYSEMQRVFRARLSNAWPDYSTRLTRLKTAGAGSPESVLAEFAEVSRGSISRMALSLEPERLQEAVRRLAGARIVHVVGLRRAFSVAAYLAYSFEKVGRPTMLHDMSGRLDHAGMLAPDDALLAISFAPYTPETVALAQHAKARGLSVIAITDSQFSPLAPHSDVLLGVDELDFGAFRSLAATFCLAATLAVATGAALEGG